MMGVEDYRGVFMLDLIPSGGNMLGECSLYVKTALGHGLSLSQIILVN